ncbi:MAG: c-type cytochrome [Verrucomicrobiota bacterium]
MKPLRLGFLTLISAGIALAAAPAPARLSGRIESESGGPARFAQVRVEGAALAGRENSQVIQRAGNDGTFEVSLPPGAYEIWVTAPVHEETTFRLEVASGATVNRDLRLPALQRTPYRVETVALPRPMIPEVSGVAFTPRGSLIVTNRRGEVWIRHADGGRWRRLADGLHEPFGVVAADETDVFVIQRPELTRLRDLDGDGVAEIRTTVADHWGITGSYHEFSYGLVRDRAGNFYASSGLCSFGRGVELPWTRGRLRTEQYLPWTGPGAVPDGHRSVAEFQGWAFQIATDGTFRPYASGFRQPLGVGLSPDDELFISDCAGAWVPTSVLIHVARGAFHGHPDSLKWHPELRDQRLSAADVSRLRRPPAVYLPRGLMGTSPGQPVWDQTGGKFGPFAGQVFLGDVSAVLMRIDLEKVGGAYQGAAFPFLRGQGLRMGGMRHAFGPDGALYLGQTVRGWMPTGGNEGLQRITWDGTAPVEILTQRLAERGFVLTFTVPMGAAAAEARHYRFKRFRYDHHPLDGSLRREETEVPVTTARIEPGGRRLHLELAEVQPGLVHELTVASAVTSAGGAPLLNRVSYYTLNRLADGTSVAGPSHLVASAEPAPRPGDPRAGADLYRLHCATCHGADGKGSLAAGPPDYTGARGLRTRSDEELARIVTEGRLPEPPAVNPMPPWGNVLPAQAIRDVVAYLREAFP